MKVRGHRAARAKYDGLGLFAAGAEPRQQIPYQPFEEAGVEGRVGRKPGAPRVQRWICKQSARIQDQNASSGYRAPEDNSIAKPDGSAITESVLDAARNRPKAAGRTGQGCKDKACAVLEQLVDECDHRNLQWHLIPRSFLEVREERSKAIFRAGYWTPGTVYLVQGIYSVWDASAYVSWRGENLDSQGSLNPGEVLLFTPLKKHPTPTFPVFITLASVSDPPQKTAGRVLLERVPSLVGTHWDNRLANDGRGNEDSGSRGGSGDEMPSKVVVGKFGSTFRFEPELNRTEHKVQVQGSANC
ncbi:hypothetical protein C8R43DRAFT_966139 [Mycena crocata]|nr:hypothetical protein C8R43DRAFT_966139 [Mycena crocata]